MYRRVWLAVSFVALALPSAARAFKSDVILDNDPKQVLKELDDCLKEPTKSAEGARLLQRLLDSPDPCYVESGEMKGARIDVAFLAERRVRAEKDAVYKQYRKQAEAAAEAALEAAGDDRGK